MFTLQFCYHTVGYHDFQDESEMGEDGQKRKPTLGEVDKARSLPLPEILRSTVKVVS